MTDDNKSVTSATSTTTETKSLIDINNELVAKSYAKLSENLANFLTRANGCDVKLEIGKEGETTEFYAHSPILRARSSYFDKALSKKTEETETDTPTTTVSYYTALFKTFMAGTDSNTIIFREENISPKIFRIILDYIYSGVGKFDEIEKSQILSLFEACDVLGIYGSSDYLQSYILENNEEWVRQNLLVIEKFSSDHTTYEEIRSYCLDQLCQNPEIVFNDTIELGSLRKGVLDSLLKRDDLIEDEILLWNFIIKWGIAQDQQISKKEKSDWTKEDYAKLHSIMGDLIPLIRFKWIKKEDFFQQVRPYKQLFDSETYENAIELYFLKPEDTPTEPTSQPTSYITAQPNTSIIQIDSKARDRNTNLIIHENRDYTSIIASWIDNKPFKSGYQPYKFKLLYRGSSNNFSRSTFHEKCDNVTKTLTIIRLKDSGELIGGYNPRTWKVAGQKSTSYPIYSKKAFIFKLDKGNLEKSILSRAKNFHNALTFDKTTGPNFNDLIIYDQNSPIDHSKNFYEKGLDITSTLMEDYEVYRVLSQF